MKQTPIIMSGNHPKLILDGTKTMTRRVIKDPRRPSRSRDAYLSSATGKPSVGDIETELSMDLKPNFPCPYGQVGDRLWVRETWKDAASIPYLAISGESRKELLYKADETEALASNVKWSPSIFMPRRASRILLEITEVRAERLQEISHDDCLREGIMPQIPDWHFKELADYVNYIKDQYRILWDPLNAKRGYSWDKNKWVWPITFKRLEAAQ